MSSIFREYFERFRGRRNFIVGVLLGVFSGSFFSIAIQYIEQFIPFQYYQIFIVLDVILSIFTALIAFRFASKSERIEQMYEVKIESASISGVCKTLLSEASNKKTTLSGEVFSVIESLNAFLGSEEGLIAGNLEILRANFRRTSAIIPNIPDKTVKDLIIKICKYMKTIEDMTSTLINTSQSSKSVFIESGYDVLVINNGVRIIKRKILLKDILIDISFESNVTRSLISPTMCYIQIFPPHNRIEYQRLFDSLNHLFSRIALSEELSELGIHFENVETLTFLRDLRERIVVPIYDKIEESNDIIIRELDSKLSKDIIK